MGMLPSEDDAMDDGMRKKRAFVDGFANGAYATLCYPCGLVGLREESANCGRCLSEILHSSELRPRFGSETETRIVTQCYTRELRGCRGPE